MKWNSRTFPSDLSRPSIQQLPSATRSEPTYRFHVRQLRMLVIIWRLFLLTGLPDALGFQLFFFAYVPGESYLYFSRSLPNYSLPSSWCSIVASTSSVFTTICAVTVPLILPINNNWAFNLSKHKARQAFRHRPIRPSDPWCTCIRKATVSVLWRLSGALCYLMSYLYDISSARTFDTKDQHRSSDTCIRRADEVSLSAFSTAAIPPEIIRLSCSPGFDLIILHHHK